MPSLHIVNHSPYTHSTLSDCLAHIGESDVILLIEDGVYAIQHALYQDTQATSPNKIYVLKNDMLIRGVDITPAINTVNYNEMVTLTEHFHPIQSWF